MADACFKHGVAVGGRRIVPGGKIFHKFRDFPRRRRAERNLTGKPVAHNDLDRSVLPTFSRIVKNVLHKLPVNCANSSLGYGLARQAGNILEYF